MFYLSSFVWMSIWSLISIYIYYKDKKAATAGEYRVDELTLDALIVLGGWPGCFIAQRMFKHKHAVLTNVGSGLSLRSG
jgi:uncharacterized membrane protein YsdA (DUF1294 family)